VGQWGVTVSECLGGREGGWVGGGSRSGSAGWEKPHASSCIVCCGEYCRVPSRWGVWCGTVFGMLTRITLAYTSSSPFMMCQPS
jgi:hypothetical protein